MKDSEIEQLIKDKSEINKQIMRQISILFELMNEVRESDSCGCSNGWEYTFKKISKDEKELN